MFTLGLNGAKRTDYIENCFSEAGGPTDSHYNDGYYEYSLMCHFWRYTVWISEILGHLYVFFKVSDGTTGFLDENWSSTMKKIKKSTYDLYSLYF